MKKQGTGAEWAKAFYIPSSFGPPPPSGTTQSIIWYGSAMSHVLQCTQFAALIFSFTLPFVSLAISYTAAGQKYWQGFPYSSTHFVAQMPVSATCRWHG